MCVRLSIKSGLTVCFLTLFLSGAYASGPTDQCSGHGSLVGGGCKCLPSYFGPVCNTQQESVCVLQNAHDNGAIHGTLVVSTTTLDPSSTSVKLVITGVPAGPYELTVHEYGDLTDASLASVGNLFVQGYQSSSQLLTFESLTATAVIDLAAQKSPLEVSLTGENSIVGRAVLVAPLGSGSLVNNAISMCVLGVALPDGAGINNTAAGPPAVEYAVCNLSGQQQGTGIIALVADDVKGVKRVSIKAKVSGFVRGVYRLLERPNGDLRVSPGISKTDVPLVEVDVAHESGSATTTVAGTVSSYVGKSFALFNAENKLSGNCVVGLTDIDRYLHDDTNPLNRFPYWLLFLLFIFVVFSVACVMYGIRYLRRRKHRGFVNIPMTDVDEETIEQTVLASRTYLHRNPQYKLEAALEQIGFRPDKVFMYVSDIKTEKKLLLLTRPIPAKLTYILDSHRARVVFKKLLTSVVHPYIDSIAHVEFAPTFSYMFLAKPYNSKGSLRDYLYTVHNPRKLYTSKYRGHGEPMGTDKTASFGRQILEAMLFLKRNGIPCLHVHSGNVLVYGKVVKLTDVEGPFFHVPPLLERHLRVLRKKNKFKITDEVFVFGHLLYEMATGELLDTPFPDEIPTTCEPPCARILNGIFFPKVSPAPKMEDLLTLPFFAEAHLPEELPDEKVLLFDKDPECADMLNDIVKHYSHPEKQKYTKGSFRAALALSPDMVEGRRREIDLDEL